MLLRLLPLFLFILSPIVIAREISVTSDQINFNLKFENENKIVLTGQQINLGLEKNKCNQKIFQRFTTRVEKLIKAKALSTSAQKNRFLLVIDDKKYYENPNSKIGRAWLYLPREFQRVKIENKMKCSKK